MKVFIKKIVIFLFILSVPALLLLVPYIYFDPFSVVKKYDVWYENPVPPNRDYVSTEIYLAQKDRYNYDSFIFGSSRTISFYADSWKDHLDKTAVPFKFDASKEGIYGIYSKLKYLDSQKVKINNALILFCRSGFAYSDNFSEHLTIKHPTISGEGLIKFHFTHLRSYFNLRFLLGYYYYILSGKQNTLTNGIIQLDAISLDYKSNQLKLDNLELLIKGDSLKYYKDRKRNNIFYKRKGVTYEKKNMIKDEQIKILKSIKEILERNHTKYKILLTPIYDEIKLSKHDNEVLKYIYGKNLYDFTGKNFITENDGNWYEADHFRPFVADSMLKLVYKN